MTDESKRDDRDRKLERYERALREIANNSAPWPTLNRARTIARDALRDARLTPTGLMPAGLAVRRMT